MEPEAAGACAPPVDSEPDGGSPALKLAFAHVERAQQALTRAGADDLQAAARPVPPSHPLHMHTRPLETRECPAESERH